MINLDDILPHKAVREYLGLQNNSHAYDIYVRALSTDTGVSDTGFAERLIAIDTPITQANGKSLLKYGTASLTWNAIDNPNILGPTFSGGQYHIRYQRMADDIYSDYWDSLDYGTGVFTEDNIGTGITAYDLEPISYNAIYAIQLRYELTRTGVPTKVHAARDVYVWAAPTTDVGTGKRFPPSRKVATIPFFGHWSSGDFDYSICQNTFHPQSDKEEWAALITHAFENWEINSNEVITINPPTVEDCEFAISYGGSPEINLPGTPSPDDIPMGMVLSSFNDTNEIFMVNTELWADKKWDHAKTAGNLIFLCVFYAPACVVSSDYYDHNQDPALRLDRNNFSWLGPPPGSTDMLINRNRIVDSTDYAHYRTGILNLPGGDSSYERSDTPFNTCLAPREVRSDNLNTDRLRFFPYSLIVHEVGHALGLSGYDSADIGDSILSGFFSDESIEEELAERLYPRAHPTIPDSVMNYDYEVELYDPVPAEMIPQRYEPDCSPHQLDLMALHILYQTVN